MCGLAQLAHRARPGQLHSAPQVLGGRALVAHLRNDLLLDRGLTHDPRLVDRARQRLLAIDVLAQLHGRHRGHGMGVVGRGDQDRVDLAVHFVEHLAEIDVALGLAGTSGASASARRWSTSHRATMFSPAMLPCSDSPWPHAPTTAMCSFSLARYDPSGATVLEDDQPGGRGRRGLVENDAGENGQASRVLLDDGGEIQSVAILPRPGTPEKRFARKLHAR